MKLTIELDPASLQKAAAKEETATAAPAKAESPAPVKQAATKQSAADKPPVPQSKKSEVNQLVDSPEKPSQRPAPASGNFAHMGGLSNISDPDKDKPGVFKFSYTEEKR